MFSDRQLQIFYAIFSLRWGGAVVVGQDAVAVGQGAVAVGQGAVAVGQSAVNTNVCRYCGLAQTKCYMPAERGK